MVDDGPGPPTAGTAGTKAAEAAWPGSANERGWLGGWLEAGSGPEGGFVVRAFLPELA